MSEGEVIDIGFWQLISAYVFVLILLLIVKLRDIHMEKEIIISSIRMTIQLVLVGYVLTYIFDNDHPLLVMTFLVVMLAFAIFNIYKRVRVNLGAKLKKIIALSLIAGTLTSIGYFLLVVIAIYPWYSARYFIPIAGMIVGNSMTGISLGVNHLIEGIENQWPSIEGALMLGARPSDAVKQIVNQAFDSAVLPTINSMVGMGIVFLPGMMTGQILSGISPITAIQYQIAIMLGIVGSVSLTVILFVTYGYRTFFNDRSQLVEIDKDN